MAGLEDQAIPLFEDAIDRKRSEFGPDHAEVAVSLDELGIQYFARSMFVESLTAFEEARRIRVKQIGGTCNHPKVAMVLNNIACCKFQMKKYDEAIAALLEARDILSNATGLSATDDLDLLHMAITHCNYAYLLVRAKQYEEARSIFEEALLVRSQLLSPSCVYYRTQKIRLLKSTFYVSLNRSSNPFLAMITERFATPSAISSSQMLSTPTRLISNIPFMFIFVLFETVKTA